MEGLEGRLALVTGVANKRSIAFAIAKTLAEAGVRVAITYLPTERPAAVERVRGLGAEIGAEHVLPLDVTDEATVEALFDTLRTRWGRLHVLVHAIAGARRGELGGRHSETSLEGYLMAHRISAYSLIQLTRAARPLLAAEGGSVVTLTYIGSVRSARNYNVMGTAKASLEADVRYLAMELGPENIRVNAVSAGPIRTLSASGIRDFLEIVREAAETSALRRNVDAGEVARASAFLASPAASGITGQVLYVDAGHNIWG